MGTTARLFESATFAVFWKAYPLKTHRVQALCAWGKLGDDPVVQALIMKDLETREWRVIDGRQVIPNPATYLNQRRWEDQTATVTLKPIGAALQQLKHAQNEAYNLTDEQRRANMAKLRAIADSIAVKSI